MAKTLFSAMLAHHLDEDMLLLQKSQYYPMYASFKLDGIRGIGRPHGIVSRSDKPLPSSYVQTTFGFGPYDGFDGEMVSRVIRPGLVYKDTYSACMTHGAQTPVDWYLFDHHTHAHMPYRDRLAVLHAQLAEHPHPHIKVLEQKEIFSWEELLEYEKLALDLGFEGLVVRRKDAPYKYGRSTGPQQWMMAMVRIAKSEFVITGVYEGLSNQNEAIIDSRGYTTRSKHMEQMVGKGMVGGFYGHDYHSKVEFKIGVAEGLDHDTRRAIWQNPNTVIGKITKYKFKPYGVDVAPRQPVMLWGEWRSEDDMKR